MYEIKFKQDITIDVFREKYIKYRTMNFGCHIMSTVQYDKAKSEKKKQHSNHIFIEINFKLYILSFDLNYGYNEFNYDDNFYNII